MKISVKRKTDSNDPTKHWNRKIWPKIRNERMEIDGYRCVICDSTEDLQVHHVSYRFLNTEDEIYDCRTVCQSCHKRLHKK